MKIRAVVAKLKDCRRKSVLNTPDSLLNILKKCANEIGARVFSQHIYKFTPQGISAVLIIGESHIAIHTYPEFNSAYFVATVCREADLKKGLKIVEKELDGKVEKEKYLEI